jgi:hypothetical protein
VLVNVVIGKTHEPPLSGKPNITTIHTTNIFQLGFRPHRKLAVFALSLRNTTRHPQVHSNGKSSRTEQTRQCNNANIRRSAKIMQTQTAGTITRARARARINVY